MKNRSYALNITLVLITAVCTYLITPLTSGVATAQQGAPQGAQCPEKVSDYQTGAVLYMQKAGEYRALAYQAYNIAAERLDRDHKNIKKLPKSIRKHPRAVVVDIDETVLDNSPDSATQIKDNRPYDEINWAKWVEKAGAKAIPGAVDFLNHANDMGYKVFYISNRKDLGNQKEKTILNLTQAGFKNVTPDTVLLRTAERGKKARRDSLTLQNYEIVMLVGDNLDDFSEVFETKTVAERFLVVENNRKNFGTKFIALPNAIYGSWLDLIGRTTADRLNALELP